VDAKGRRLAWAGLRDISPSLIRSVVRSEDKRFYEHSGVDWTALGSAAVSHLFSDSNRGASTISMQLVSMLEKELKPKGTKRSFAQKWDQISASRELERHWSKEQILEAYLNLITFRSELQGIVAASRGLFGKEPSGLDERESLLLAALIRSPNAKADVVASRACLLAGATDADDDCSRLHDFARTILNRPYHISPHANLAPHVARQLLTGGRLTATSTLDGPLQKFASEVLTRQLGAISRQNVHDGAVLVIENRTGDILAYVANSGDESSARHVDGIMAKRQAGSTLKPFLYGLAIELRLMTSASLIDDSPVDVPTPAGLYMPHNYDNDFKGLVSARTALSSSLNVPAIRTLMQVGPDAFARRLKTLGFHDLNEGDYYGLSMALGSVEVSLLELTNAYRAIANGGVWSRPSLAADGKKPAARRATGRESAFIISDILSDRTARGLTFGYENPLSTRFWSAVKTGTSKDMRDNWCIGFSSAYTVGVWIGNFSGASMWNVSGVSGAAPAWLEIMNYLHNSKTSTAPAPPPGVLARKVDFAQYIEPARTEWFIRGTEPLDTRTERPTQPVEQSTAESPSILYPPKDTVFAIDPDIPADNSAIFFQSTKKGEYNWVLDKIRIGDCTEMVAWKPTRGRHELSLMDMQDKVIDTVRFEVRGAPPSERPPDPGNDPED